MLLWFQLKEMPLCLRFESQVNQAQVAPSVMSFFNKVQDKVFISYVKHVHTELYQGA